MDLGCPLLRGSSDRRLRRCAATRVICLTTEIYHSNIRETWSNLVTKSFSPVTELFQTVKRQVNIQFAPLYSKFTAFFDLHVFNDTTLTAFCTINYVRQSSANYTSPNLKLAFRKSPVAPITQASGPRLKVKAAVLRVSEMHFIHNARPNNLCYLCFWTGS